MTTENSSNETNYENGDVHDGDSGDYFFTLPNEAKLPASIQIYYDGFWYVFKIDGRQKEEQPEPEIKINIVEEAPIEPTIDPLKDL